MNLSLAIFEHLKKTIAPSAQQNAHMINQGKIGRSVVLRKRRNRKKDKRGQAGFSW
jgi:hypothetical protein